MKKTDGTSSGASGGPEGEGPLEKEDSDLTNYNQFQLKEYENISQAHFKTNEVLATFYRYFLLITAIPITALTVALVNFLDDTTVGADPAVAYFIAGVAGLLFGTVGWGMLSYIEGLRLDAILYARWVNSIRRYFYSLKPNDEAPLPALPTDSRKPDYGGFGSSYIIFVSCAVLNCVIFGLGMMALTHGFKSFQMLKWLPISTFWIGAIASGIVLLFHLGVRSFLIKRKEAHGL